MANLENLDSSFLIVDLGASLPFTHHKQSLYAFSSLLSTRKIENNIWVPIGSEIPKLDYPIKKILLPGTHVANFNFFRPTTWIGSALNRLYLFASKFHITLLLKARVIITSYFLYYSISHLSKIKNIIFTTACPYTFSTIYLLEAKKIKISIFVRLTNTSENRGDLSKLFNFENLIIESRNFKYVDVRFGIETENYFSRLKLENNSKAYISKFPSAKIQSFSKPSSTNIVISFLGYPTKEKGHEHILPIIVKVSKFRPEFKWQVHLYENDPLENFFKTIEADVIIASGKINSNEMDRLLATTNLMCLPYNPIAFKYHASAMHYQAMDYLIPSICLSGASFAYDIKKYNSGAVAKNINDISKILIDLNETQIHNWVLGCEKYNNFRNLSNKKFLGII